MDWEFLDIGALLSARDLQHEAAAGIGGATTSANAAPYAGPIGGMLRRQVPSMAGSCSGDEECVLHHAYWNDLYGQ